MGGPPTEPLSDEHQAFAASRVTQFVFVPTRDTFLSTLDAHADCSENDVKLPLVVVGGEGAGKSALLANWMAKHREHKSRDEFLFSHYVGCTTPSLTLAHTLARLVTALKQHFQLREMKIPDGEEELRWSLSRFLVNAAKKHNPARIIIILDGINRLKCEGMPDGSLHWLPIELPPCVRFIVSTVEFERAPKGVVDVPQHRTYIELVRRNCPVLRIDPMNQQNRNAVILAFLSSSIHGTMVLTEQQQFKIISAPATSQPMYLRSLLQAIRLSSSLTDQTVDQLLEQFLFCSTAHELVDKNLDICTKAVFSSGESGALGGLASKDSKAAGAVSSEILGKVFSIVHVSRTGLTEAEIWGVLKMVTQVTVEEELARQLINLLSAFTMVVDDMHSFSHEIYREVVYDKYIRTRQELVQWHFFMARYFDQLPTCERKLVALPFHLEFAGAWSKVKNCLTDINMFQLWWTPRFKTDFIKFWASLTRVNKKDPKDAHGTSGHGTKGDTGFKQEKDTRPHYDVVEEYVKSLDEFRRDEHPSEEQLASIILLIADFLLEFAELGHEAQADVPSVIHPLVPHSDLEAIGVPFIREDDMGRSELHLPQVFNSILLPKVKEGDGEQSGDQGPAKAVSDIPFCTTYFFHRWMWIQFPFIALGNCNTRFLEGVKLKETSDLNYASPSKGRLAEGEEGGAKKDNKEASTAARTFNTNAFKLPAITFNRKAARSHRRVPADDVDPAQAAADKVTQRMDALHDDIQNYREECDFIMQMKSGLQKRLAELSGNLETLKRSAESVHQFDDLLTDAKARDEDASNKFESVKLLNANLKKLAAMCDRHPANVPALILEIENKIEQDVFIISEIKKRLWEQKFEQQMHGMNYKIMKFLQKKGEKMHTKLLEYRVGMKMGLTQQQSEDERRLLESTQSRTGGARTKRPKLLTNGTAKGEGKEQDSGSRQGQTWEEMWPIISSRTGIVEPDIFFMRLSNGCVALLFSPLHLSPSFSHH